MKLTFSVIVFLLLVLNAKAQESLFANKEIISPEIHQDKSVTFRALAPHADSVQLTGDFLPTIKADSPFGPVDAPGKVSMKKTEGGIWTYTTSVLNPELYNYSFIIDGINATDPNNPFLIRDVANVTNIFVIGGKQADLYKVNNVPHGTISKRWYKSTGLNMERRLTIYTSPGYESNKSMKYPVLYLLHGAGGDEEAWMDLGRTAQIMDNLIAQGKAKPMIVVMPNANVIQDAAPGQGRDGFYKPQFMVPQTMNGQYEANFMEIVQFIESNYNVKKGKSHRAIAGLSMGGYHAMHISRYYPNTFDYIGLFSAAIMPREDATKKVYNDLDGTLEKQKANGCKLYWIAIGKTDFLYKANTEFRTKLDGMGFKYEYVESEGGHIWRNWRVYLSQFAPRLF